MRLRAQDTRSVFGLLVFACALTVFSFGAVNYLRMETALRGHAPSMIVPVAIAFAFLVSAAIIWADRRDRDPLLLPLTALLIGLGFALLLHVQPKDEYVPRQLQSFLIGIVVLTAVARAREVRRLARFKYLCAALAVVLLLLVIKLGKPLGAEGDIRLAIPIGPIQFQPADLVRILIVVFLAGFLGEKREALTHLTPRWWMLSRSDARYLGPMVLAWGLAMLLLIYQRDLGAALLMFGIFIGMLYAASARMLYVLIGLLLFAGGAYLCYHRFPVVEQRLEIWWNPWNDPEDRGYQIVQSLYALGGGKVFGAGLGQGAAKWVPAVHTDLIFVAAAEEMGLLGAAAILMIYVVLVYRGFRIAARCRDPVNALIAAGLSLALGLQTLVIVGGVTEVTPLTGVTLPFMSFGGSSLVANCALIGLLLSISAEEG